MILPNGPARQRPEFSAGAAVSLLLLCGAGTTPTGTAQKADINAQGYSITNAYDFIATNEVVTPVLANTATNGSVTIAPNGTGSVSLSDKNLTGIGATGAILEPQNDPTNGKTEFGLVVNQGGAGSAFYLQNNDAGSYDDLVLRDNNHVAHGAFGYGNNVGGDSNFGGKDYIESFSYTTTPPDFRLCMDGVYSGATLTFHQVFQAFGATRDVQIGDGAPADNGNAVQLTGNVSISGNVTGASSTTAVPFTSGITVGSANGKTTIGNPGSPSTGYLGFVNLNASGSDNAIWDFEVGQDGNNLDFCTVNDARNAGAAYMKVARSGNAATSVTFPEKVSALGLQDTTSGHASAVVLGTDGSGNIAPSTSGTLPAFNGSALTSLNGSNISSGTVADGRLSANVPLLNAGNLFTQDMRVQKDALYNSGYAQMTLQSATDSNYQTFFGVDNTNQIGYCFALHQTVGYLPWAINPLGGNVLIGTASDNGTDKLQVNGSVRGAGVTDSVSGHTLAAAPQVVASGTVTLSAGAATITATGITATSVLDWSISGTKGANAGAMIATASSGSMAISSTNGSDTDTINYRILQ